MSGVRVVKLSNENTSLRNHYVLSFARCALFVLSSFKGEIIFKYSIAEPLPLQWNLNYNEKRQFYEKTKEAYKKLQDLRGKYKVGAEAEIT